ncbi:BON domain-containing protein [Candidatus Thorarchaeota archaeon]|nr:MAG: BON domain-containing protein [Candidatus Thorarchaeota archaeon]
MSEDIKKRVVDELYFDNRVDASEIEVAVKDGNVTLEGEVDSFYTRSAAAEDAWAVIGVTDVHNELDVSYPVEIEIMSDEDIASSIDSKLLWNTAIDSTKIDVSVDGGVIELEGTVDAYWKKLRAGTLAMDVSGVMDVHNELAVVPTYDYVDEAIAKDIMDSLERRFTVDEEKVNVEVENGIVTLTGTVEDYTAYTSAENAAELTAGVIDVENKLYVK